MLSREANRDVLANEVVDKAVKVTSFPTVMYLESQRGCPYDCIMCTVPKSYGRAPTEMPDAILERLSPYFKYLETLAIHGNGEALLSKEIERYVDIARDNDCFLHCNTTALPINRKLSDKLVEAKLDIRFSIHAGRPETYRRIMDADLESTLKKIDYLLEHARAKGQPNNTFWFSFIVMAENINEIDDFLTLAHSVGIKEVRFMKLLPNHRTLPGTRRSPGEVKFYHHEQANARVFKQFLDRLPDIRAKADELGINLGSGNMAHWTSARVSLRDLSNRIHNKLFDRNLFPLTPLDGDCVAPWTGQVQIEQNGDVGLCCAVKHVIGNLYENDFAEIWNNHEMQRIRAEFNRGKMPKVCGFCKGINTDEYDIPVNRLIDELSAQRTGDNESILNNL